MNPWKDAAITAIIAAAVATLCGVLAITYVERNWQSTCYYVPQDQKYKTPCREE